jgi:hypothetical protein
MKSNVRFRYCSKNQPSLIVYLQPFFVTASVAGLPDGLFSKQKSKFGSILEGFGIERVGIFFGHLEYITAIWYVLWPFGNLFAIWCISPVLVYYVEKNLATLLGSPKVSFKYDSFSLEKNGKAIFCEALLWPG